MLSRRGLDFQILSLLRLWHPFGSARIMCYCRFVSRSNPVKSQGPTHFSLTSLDLFFFLFNDCWVYSRFGHYNSIIFTCYRNTRSPGHWTASPVPTDPKLVSFHKIAKCQTFFTCKTFWLVESIESDWGRQLLRGSGQVWNSNWPSKGGALQYRFGAIDLVCTQHRGEGGLPKCVHSK